MKCYAPDRAAPHPTINTVPLKAAEQLSLHLGSCVVFQQFVHTQ